MQENERVQCVPVEGAPTKQSKLISTPEQKPMRLCIRAFKCQFTN